MAFHKEKGNIVTAITVDGSIPEDRYALIFKADGFDGVFGYSGLLKTEKISFNTENNRFFITPILSLTFDPPNITIHGFSGHFNSSNEISSFVFK